MDSGMGQDENTSKKQTYRSFKLKKYMKIRHNFKEKLRQSNDFYDEEQRLVRLATRLQEQNDQLLDLLLDVNDSTKIPPHLQYDLRSGPPSPSDVPSLLTDDDPGEERVDIVGVESAFEEARTELRSGVIDEETFAEMESSLAAVMKRARILTSLSKINHSTLFGEGAVPKDMVPADISEVPPTGYLSPAHEDEYLSTLDAFLETVSPDSTRLPPKPQLSEREKERDMQLNNPMSVYNWLSKHNHIFIDQSDEHPQANSNSSSGAKERSFKSNHNSIELLPFDGVSATGAVIGSSHHSHRKQSSPKLNSAPTRSTKRERTSTAAAEPEWLDEEGFVIGGIGTSEYPEGKKRKRGKEDEAYRPKGGSSRPSKRKRASTGLSKTDRGSSHRKASDIVMDDD